MKCIHLSFYALDLQTKCLVLTLVLCHLPSSLMKKVRVCCAQSRLVQPPSPTPQLSISGFRATCAMLSEKDQSNGREDTAVLPCPSWSSADTSPQRQKARRPQQCLLCCQKAALLFYPRQLWFIRSFLALNGVMAAIIVFVLQDLRPLET